MFKKLLIGLAALGAVQAGAVELKIKIFDVQAFNQELMQEARPSALPFKVGETADYKLSLGGFLEGTMNMLVREETADGIWLEQNIDLMIQKQKVETLFDKETGQVKKVLVDGQEQKLEQGEAPEIVESKPDTITVPKGTFECSYIKLKDKEGTETELWVNPELVPIMGLIKMASQSQIGPVTIELVDFKDL